MAILFLESGNGSGDMIIKALEESKMGGVISKSSLADLQGYAEKSDVSRIELIMMEPGLQDVEGEVLCRCIKKMEQFKSLPLLVVNQGLKAEQIAPLLLAGIDDYVSDPANQVELLSRVNMALKLSRAQYRNSKEREMKENVSRYMSASEINGRENQQDALTGLASPEYLDDNLGKEWKRASRGEHSLSVVMCDIDHFKDYERVCGEEAGELCIIKVGKALADELKRPGDLVSRYEGDCFAALLPDTDLLGATVLAEIMRTAVSKLRIPHPASAAAQHVTISLGVASAEFKEGADPGILLEQARKALQRAKDTGRNRVVNLA